MGSEESTGFDKPSAHSRLRCEKCKNERLYNVFHELHTKNGRFDVDKFSKEAQDPKKCSIYSVGSTEVYVLLDDPLKKMDGWAWMKVNCKPEDCAFFCRCGWYKKYYKY